MKINHCQKYLLAGWIGWMVEVIVKRMIPRSIGIEIIRVILVSVLAFVIFKLLGEVNDRRWREGFSEEQRERN